MVLCTDSVLRTRRFRLNIFPDTVLFNEDDVNASMDRIEVIDFHQSITMRYGCPMRKIRARACIPPPW